MTPESRASINPVTPAALFQAWPEHSIAADGEKPLGNESAH